MDVPRTNNLSPNISRYLSDYKKRYIAFAAVAAYLENACRSILHSNGILANVASRAKEFDRLEGKLHQRKTGHDFDSIDDIEEEITDLIGVRVTTYFPNQVEEVCAIFESLFSNGTLDVNKREDKVLPAQELLDKITHDKSIATLDTSPTCLKGQKNPYQARYGSYRATHVHFTMKKHDLGTVLSDLLGNRRLKVEVQIQSLFMHSWSDVEHELCYKSLTGKPSTEEHQLLDCLNGIEKLGEHVLIQLKKSLDLRLTDAKDHFTSPFELAEYIRRYLESESTISYVLGDVEDFLDFLIYAKKNDHKTIQAELQKLKSNHNTNQPIVYLLIVNMLGKTQFDGNHPFLLDDQNAKIDDAPADNVIEVLATILDVAFRRIIHATPDDKTCSKSFELPASYLKLRKGLNLYDDTMPALPGTSYPVNRAAIKNFGVQEEIRSMVKWFNDNCNTPLIQYNLNMAQLRAWKIYATTDVTKSFAQMSSYRSKL